jgi:hypothetical protein
MRISRLARRSAVAGGVVALGVAATAAAAGGLSVGSILTSDDNPTPPEFRQTDETVVALGSEPLVGPWRLVTYSSPELVDDGEVLQPEGLPCLKLLLSGSSQDPFVATRSYCGERGQGGLAAAALPVEGQAGRVSTVLFGQAPEAASKVHMVDSVGWRKSAEVHEGPGSSTGDYWLYVMPPRAPADQTWVEWTDSTGKAREDRADLSLELLRPMDPVPLPSAAATAR